PKLYPTNIGYVPVQPYWSGFSNPKDVFVGFDEMVYVIDDNGVHILDLKGQEHAKISIPGATDIIQDRRQHTYVSGRILKDIDNNGTLENLPAVYHFYNASSASGPIFVDTLIHPYCDATRNTEGFRGIGDEQIEFTGLAALSDNRIYVSRKGPKNLVTTVAIPDNSILIFDKNGTNIGYCNGLNSSNSNLKSTLDVASIATSQVPPQQYVDAPNWFYLVQQAPNAEYKVLQIKEFNDVDAGTSFGENQALLNFDDTKANRFLYESFRFKKPSDVFVAPDATGYVFVVDEETDSLYQFTPKGFEGVNPAANSGITKQIIASFGGSGNGPFQFNKPSGVCYFKRTIYVADKGNNRICRFKLSTDLE
ncbi:MAG: hypothetical protein RIQ33_2307, partial [Bacteroidota bacterium]